MNPPRAIGVVDRSCSVQELVAPDLCPVRARLGRSRPSVGTRAAPAPPARGPDRARCDRRRAHPCEEVHEASVVELHERSGVERAIHSWRSIRRSPIDPRSDLRRSGIVWPARRSALRAVVRYRSRSCPCSSSPSLRSSSTKSANQRIGTRTGSGDRTPPRAGRADGGVLARGATRFASFFERKRSRARSDGSRGTPDPRPARASASARGSRRSYRPRPGPPRDHRRRARSAPGLPSRGRGSVAGSRASAGSTRGTAPTCAMLSLERVERLEHTQVGAGDHLGESSDGGHLLCSRRPRPRS